MLGRLVVPGKQDFPIWLTLVIGVVAAILGTLPAGALDVAHTDGIDWIEILLQVEVRRRGRRPGRASADTAPLTSH